MRFGRSLYPVSPFHILRFCYFAFSGSNMMAGIRMRCILSVAPPESLRRLADVATARCAGLMWKAKCNDISRSKRLSFSPLKCRAVPGECIQAVIGGAAAAKCHLVGTFASRRRWEKEQGPLHAEGRRSIQQHQPCSGRFASPGWLPLVMGSMRVTSSTIQTPLKAKAQASGSRVCGQRPNSSPFNSVAKGQIIWHGACAVAKGARETSPFAAAPAADPQDKLFPAPREIGQVLINITLVVNKKAAIWAQRFIQRRLAEPRLVSGAVAGARWSCIGVRARGRRGLAVSRRAGDAAEAAAGWHGQSSALPARG